jgi:hypothetical protein
MEAVVELVTSDLKPIIPADVKRRVIDAIVRNVKTAPFGYQIDATEWRKQLAINLHRIFNGVTLNLNLLREKLMHEVGANEADLFVLAVRIAQDLRTVHVHVAMTTRLAGEAREQLRMEALATIAEEVAGARDDKSDETHVMIGDMLVDHGLITPEQLQEGLRAQRYYGGRLGTNLVELGMVRADALAHFLGVQLGIPAVDPKALEQISEDIRVTLEEKWVRKYHAVPFAREGNVLHMAMADASDALAVEELSALTGMRVSPFVAPEAVIARAIAKYYGSETEARNRWSIEYLEPEDDEDPFELAQAS